MNLSFTDILSTAEEHIPMSTGPQLCVGHDVTTQRAAVVSDANLPH